MGKGNLFNLKSKSTNRLLLITDLKGEIIHAIGNYRIINSTVHRLYLQNFFKKFLSKESCRQLYDEIQSNEVMPLWTNSRVFKSSIKGAKRNKMFRVHCYRTFIKFSTEMCIDKKIRVNTIKDEKQFGDFRNQESMEQAIIVYIEPQSQMQIPKNKEALEAKKVKSSSLQSAILINPEQIGMGPIFETPKKKLINQQEKADNTTNLLLDKFKDAEMKQKSK